MIIGSINIFADDQSYKLSNDIKFKVRNKEFKIIINLLKELLYMR